MDESVKVVDNGSNGLPMDEMWAWILVHPDGTETIPAVNGMPLVAQLRQNLERIRDQIQQGADVSGRTMRLCRFNRTEVVDEIGPQRSSPKS